MTVYPHTKLFIEGSRTILISGPHIQVLDPKTGDIISSTATLNGADKDALLKSGPIRCAAVDENCKYIATSGDDKVLKVWEVEGLKLLSRREAPKKPTDIKFTRDAQKIVVADKFGDIFSYPLHQDASEPASAPKKDRALASHDNPAGGHLVLGHTSMLTTFALTSDERFIISADRDEHIRVSWFPQGYNIERYCLGHEKYVSSIHIPKFDGAILISGGGDPMLKVWDWMLGALRYEVAVADVVYPYIKVAAPKVKSGWDEEGEGNKGKRGKNKGKSEETGTPDPATAPTANNDVGYAEADAAQTHTVLAVQKIETIEDATSGRHVLFSVTGATAVFYFPYGGAVEPSQIQAFDFNRPVLDFAPVPGSPGLLLVLLDPNFKQDLSASADQGAPLVQALRWDGSGFTDVNSADASFSTLLASMNSQCRIAADAEQSLRLDLYSPLLTLPKNAQVEHDPMDREAIEFPDQAGAETPTKGKAAKSLSAKEIARLTRKQKLEEQLRARAQGSTQDDAERDFKKPRSDDDNDQREEKMDVS